MDISVTFDSNALKKDLATFVAELAADVYKNAKANTPIKTGNARRNWTKTVTKDSAVIQNKVPYIERLEAGASRQAPKGIIRPTLTQIKGKYK
jgi:HK97 gp10 family phage protein